MEPREDTLRSLTASVAYVKLTKMVEDNRTVDEMSRRLNYFNDDGIKRLMDSLVTRQAFFQEIESINKEIRLKRVTVNADRILTELKTEPVVEPIIYRNVSFTIPWGESPKHLVPEMMSFGNYLAGKRKDWQGLARRMLQCKRKRMQIETLIQVIPEIAELDLKQPLQILDLCGGRGDLSLMIASRYPNSNVTIMDRNRQGLMQAKYRASMLGLKNVHTEEIDLFKSNQLDSNIKWDIVLGLHACGSLADVIISEFRPRCRHMFIVTCCFGKMQPTHRFSRFADSDANGLNSETSRLAKLVINSHRGDHIDGFRIIEVDERSFSSKNQILYFPGNRYS